MDPQTTSPDMEDNFMSGQLCVTSSIEELQTHDQRRVFDLVVQLRRYGLDSVLSLPQIVVCGQ